MKLLIVDDEELTRNGVISSIDWKTLGINTVLQADDGINGLSIARLHKPEIILCDVRMPRMNGITMLEHLENELPDAVAIFMSGYSDKEYLKAAIKLKAVNYIEKPLDPAEIRQAVIDAREMYLQKMHSHYGEVMQSVETASRLALALTVPAPGNLEHLIRLSAELSFSVGQNTYFTSFLVKLDHLMEIAVSITSISNQFQTYLKEQNLYCIHAEKRDSHIVYFVFGSTCLTQEEKHRIETYLHSLYSSFPKYYISAGESVKGIASAYQTYESAVILMQSSFFFTNRSILSKELFAAENISQRQLADNLEQCLADALSSRNYPLAFELQNHLCRFFTGNHSLFQNQAKDLYYKLLLTIENVRVQQHLTSVLSDKEKNISAAMEQCFSYEELHQVLTLRIEQYFEDARNRVQEHPTILLIKEYISKNYGNELLSVKDISTHVFLSTSYVCTFFKNETGQTLNQYLTEYRMEKAKELLYDPRYKITDISSRVGYSDGNYFGKSFKKYSGYSPSEFRENMVK